MPLVDAGYPLIGARVDDRGVVGAVDVRVARGDQAPGMFGEFVGAAFRQEQVIDVGADLAGVQHLDPHDAFGGGLDREVRGDDGGRLAAEFQRHRRQVARRVGHHGAAGGARAGEQQMVEGQRGEGRSAAALAIIGEEHQLVGGEIFRAQFGEQAREMT